MVKIRTRHIRWLWKKANSMFRTITEPWKPKSIISNWVRIGRSRSAIWNPVNIQLLRKKAIFADIRWQRLRFPSMAPRLRWMQTVIIRLRQLPWITRIIRMLLSTILMRRQIWIIPHRSPLRRKLRSMIKNQARSRMLLPERRFSLL